MLRLLREGADVHAANEHLNMPLHMAASWGHVDCVEALVEAKADINAQVRF